MTVYIGDTPQQLEQGLLIDGELWNKAKIEALKAQVEQLSILCLAYEDKLPFPVMSKELFEPVFKARSLLAEIKVQAVEDAIDACGWAAMYGNLPLNELQDYASQLRQQAKEKV